MKNTININNKEIKPRNIIEKQVVKRKEFQIKTALNEEISNKSIKEPVRTDRPGLEGRPNGETGMRGSDGRPGKDR